MRYCTFCGAEVPDGENPCPTCLGADPSISAKPPPDLEWEIAGGAGTDAGSGRMTRRVVRWWWTFLAISLILALAAWALGVWWGLLAWPLMLLTVPIPLIAAHKSMRRRLLISPKGSARPYYRPMTGPEKVEQFVMVLLTIAWVAGTAILAFFIAIFPMCFGSGKSGFFVG